MGKGRGVAFPTPGPYGGYRVAASSGISYHSVAGNSVEWLSIKYQYMISLSLHGWLPWHLRGQNFANIELQKIPPPSTDLHLCLVQ